MDNDAVTVRIPASTSNLGSGFDTLGLAVRLYNHLALQRAPKPGVTLGWAMNSLDREWFQPALDAAAAWFFRVTRRKTFGVEVVLTGEVPVARGLGASATVRVGMLAGLNALCGGPLSNDELLQGATELEGHPDNASPAIFGGFTVSGRVEGRVRCLSHRVSPQLKLVALIPSFGISTEEARKLMPAQYSREDTVHALNRSALIAAALAGERYDDLRGLFDDRIHQPYRERLLPQLSGVIRAGEKAGALGGFLSGSGSTILCLALDRAEAVGRAMRRQLPDAEVRILASDNDGMKVSVRQG